MNIHNKAHLCEAGQLALSNAQRNMPVLADIKAELAKSQPLSGERIAGCLHLTKETGVLIDLLHAAGAEIVWTGGDEVSTQDEVAAVLCERGITVFGWRNMLSNEVESALQETLYHFEQGPTIIIDNGARLINAAWDSPQQFPNLKFLTEKTTEGCAVLRERAATQPVPFPVYLVNDTVTKWAVDNTFGTGQSTVDGIVRATGKLLAGKVFVICGFGHVGRGVAARAAGWGARVIVCCKSAETAVKATLAGFQVMSLEDAIARADILCTATGAPGIVLKEHLERAKHNITLCNTGHSVTEIDVEALEMLAVNRELLSPLITAFTLENGHIVNLVARGGLVNLAAGEGNPSEVMDVTFSNQALCVLNTQSLAEPDQNGLHEISSEQDEDIAQRKLHSMGLACGNRRSITDEAA